MARFTRGFTGRGALERDPRLPPGQYDTGQSWPVLSAKPTPNLETESWTFTLEGLVQTPTHLELERDSSAPKVCLQRPHSLRHNLVHAQAATVVAIRPETATARTIRLHSPRPSGHLAGQHHVVRATEQGITRGAAMSYATVFTNAALVLSGMGQPHAGR